MAPIAIPTKSQKRQRRFNRDCHREIEPDSVGIGFAQQEAAVEVVHHADVREAVDVRLGQQVEVARPSPTASLRVGVTDSAMYSADGRIQLQSSRTRRIAKSVKAPQHHKAHGGDDGQRHHVLREAQPTRGRPFELSSEPEVRARIHSLEPAAARWGISGCPYALSTSARPPARPTRNNRQTVGRFTNR